MFVIAAAFPIIFLSLGSRLFEFATETAAVSLYTAQSKLKQLITR